MNGISRIVWYDLHDYLKWPHRRRVSVLDVDTSTRREQTIYLKLYSLVSSKMWPTRRVHWISQHQVCWNTIIGYWQSFFSGWLDGCNDSRFLRCITTAANVRVECSRSILCLPLDSMFVTTIIYMWRLAKLDLFINLQICVKSIW